jgi:hypothetical protein
MILAVLLLAAGGCSPVPFKEPARVSLDAVEPRSLVERFQANAPVGFQLLNTVVFEYNWRTFSSVGYLDIDGQNRAFKLALLNPLGVKLLELSGDENGAAASFAIADFSRYGDIASVIAGDVRRIYFDLVPAPDARVWKRKCSIRFRQPSGAGMLEYVYAGIDGDLIEKNYYDDEGIAWQAAFYEYREERGKRHPQGIIFRHFNYGYRLIVRQKELRS